MYTLGLVLKSDFVWISVCRQYMTPRSIWSTCWLPWRHLTYFAHFTPSEAWSVETPPGNGRKHRYSLEWRRWGKHQLDRQHGVKTREECGCGCFFLGDYLVTIRQSNMAVCQNLVPLVNIKIAGKWMFIPLKMVLIGIDPYPHGNETSPI